MSWNALQLCFAYPYQTEEALWRTWIDLSHHVFIQHDRGCNSSSARMSLCADLRRVFSFCNLIVAVFQACHLCAYRRSCSVLQFLFWVAPTTTSNVLFAHIATWRVRSSLNQFCPSLRTLHLAWWTITWPKGLPGHMYTLVEHKVHPCRTQGFDTSLSFVLHIHIKQRKHYGVLEKIFHIMYSFNATEGTTVDLHACLCVPIKGVFCFATS